MNKIMNDEQKTASDLISGSVDANSDPSAKGGESPKVNEVDLEKYVPKDQYKELEEKLGTQGSELGELREFFEEMLPLHKILQEKPEITDAILSGKFDADLAKAVLEGKVKVEDATTVAQANEEVKKEVGKEEYKGMSSEEIEKLVSAKVEEMIRTKAKNIDEKIDSIEERRERKEFNNDIAEFVAGTPDYAEYADDINKWFDEHPNQYDIQVAYDVVKGKALGSKSKSQSEIEQAEEAKRLAANAAGGGSQGGRISQKKPLIDDYVGKSSNPNTF